MWVWGPDIGYLCLIFSFLGRPCRSESWSGPECKLGKEGENLFYILTVSLKKSIISVLISFLWLGYWNNCEPWQRNWASDGSPGIFFFTRQILLLKWLGTHTPINTRTRPSSLRNHCRLLDCQSPLCSQLIFLSRTCQVLRALVHYNKISQFPTLIRNDGWVDAYLRPKEFLNHLAPRNSNYLLCLLSYL